MGIEDELLHVQVFAARVYNEMRKKGYKLDIFAYNMLLDALAKNEKVLVLKF